jgi:hypothetical protein
LIAEIARDRVIAVIGKSEKAKLPRIYADMRGSGRAKFEVEIEEFDQELATRSQEPAARS